MSAQTCGPRESIERALTRQYEETVAYIAVTKSGALLEVLVSKERDTWSIVVLNRDGTACLIAAGRTWRDLQKGGPET